MILTILISSLILSYVLLMPMSIKWELEKKVIIPSAFFIGLITVVLTYGITKLWALRYYQIFVIEFFLIIIITVSILLWRFYRDPERPPPHYKNVILSPADGRILYIKKIDKGEIPFSEKKGKRFSLDDFIQYDINLKRGYLIGIAMTYLDVHVNRNPISGRIAYMKHIKGLFISLKNKEAVIQNERLLTVVDNGNFKIGIVQIASRLVRKIVPFLREGQEAQIGARMGVIRFGSQVDLILPEMPSLQIVVKPEEKVKAGMSILANYDFSV